jgi:meso-butanediol dehydrogenase / (S,S)-butanediol dehydrogenase / diacetyl reductase
MTPVSGFANDLFQGKQVVVTGAAGGIGRAIAAAFAACGADLIRIDRPEAIPPEGRGWIGCDLADRTSLMRAAQGISGPLAALINCAGVFRRVALSEMGAVAEWDRTLAVNLTAPFLLTRALAEQLAGGAVVNITSVRAETSAERASAYTVSKGGLVALTLALADELAASGIRANAVAPGDVDTAMGHTDPDITAKLFARTPLKRMARPEEVAAACVFLASPLASHVTGATLRVDGGFLAV